MNYVVSPYTCVRGYFHDLAINCPGDSCRESTLKQADFTKGFSAPPGWIKAWFETVTCSMHGCIIQADPELRMTLRGSVESFQIDFCSSDHQEEALFQIQHTIISLRRLDEDPS